MEQVKKGHLQLQFEFIHRMRTFLERQLTVAPLFTVYLHQSGPHGGFVTRENAKMHRFS